ncbi:helix-turn-helix domain-containing protein [Bradyrhizobium sp. HKCCYLS20291]|uniref:helix-turn-helix domain-containing protein n=1 Tax=Bradyrhizobium sp. HKCCYLS20291 TaxID=3420766 RepID=UPI003EBED4D7
MQRGWCARPIAVTGFGQRYELDGIVRHANDNTPLDTVLTTADVMARLRVSRKTLYGLVAKHLPSAARVGRDYRFIEADIVTIFNGMRSSCDSTCGGGRITTVGSSGGRTPKATKSGNLQKLLTKRRPKVSASS